MIIATREVKQSGKISGINGISPVDNPFDSKVAILGNDVRLSNRIKKLNRRKNKHPDKEVQKELDKGNLVLDYQDFNAYLIDIKASKCVRVLLKRLCILCRTSLCV